MTFFFFPLKTHCCNDLWRIDLPQKAVGSIIQRLDIPRYGSGLWFDGDAASPYPPAYRWELALNGRHIRGQHEDMIVCRTVLQLSTDIQEGIIDICKCTQQNCYAQYIARHFDGVYLWWLQDSEQLQQVPSALAFPSRAE